jgi:hypothetical protein
MNNVEREVKYREYQREYQRKLRQNNPDFVRDRNRKARYGITSEEYECMFEKQGRVCAICLKNNGEKWHVDHCHNSNKIRSILCRSCNLMIGHAKDDPEILVAAAQYILDQKEERDG